VVAWFGDLGALGGATFDLDKGSVHELLEDDEDAVAAYAAAIWGERVSREEREEARGRRGLVT
jgi:hypothetical protein